MSISRAVIELVIAFAVSCACTGLLIPFLKKKQFGQFIREEGPKAHLSKQGTPTMGGVAIIAGIIIAILCSGDFSWDKLVIILTMIAYGLIGFIDDYNKIAKKENEGLKPKQKIVLQLLFGLALAIYMVLTGGTECFIPFLKINVNFGLIYIPFIIFVEVAMANAVNLTDGLDGLASSVTAIVACLFVALGLVAESGVNESLEPAGIAILGALLGFLVFNKYPAKIFMGDTGSMALGGVLSAVAIVSHYEWLLPIAGLIYVLEALSVIIQVTYFRKTGGKRFFRMAPLHHHFELGGLKETQVVTRFCLFTLVFTVIAYFAAC
ncbi:MAG: phospho-N-acetylmuramoyl-pentapeptide-transferase [Clostridiales bacterium]|jgi:phospho-N-acetylmuramoyl-pentapeptide-transferase|nr:phospho-N-acetylmuramoyl-pentapeptide-transferase [Clostridiales bacterium]